MSSRGRSRSRGFRSLRYRRWMLSAISVCTALVVLIVSAGCLPLPGMPRTIGEVEVRWAHTGRSYWYCWLAGFDYSVFIGWYATASEPLVARLRASSGGDERLVEEAASDAAEAGSGAPPSRYRLLFANGREAGDAGGGSGAGDEAPALNRQNLPRAMRRAVEGAQRIAKELMSHQAELSQALPQIPRAYVADMAELRFAIVAAEGESFRLERGVHFQGGRTVYVYESGGGGVTAKAYLSAERGFFEWVDGARRRFSILLEGDELTLQVPGPRGDAQPEHLPFRTFQEKAAGMLRLLKSEGMLEAGEEEELTDSALDTLTSHTRYDRTETVQYGAPSDPWGYVGDGG